MPELPEVETVVRDLRPLLLQRRIEEVRTSKHRLRRPWQPEWSRALTGRTIAAISRRGKWIIATLDSQAILLIHLGMTGQLTVQPAGQPRASHTHLCFLLNNQSELRFRDIRRFGSAEYFPNPAAAEAAYARKLGPEPFDLELAYFYARLRAADRPLKAVLLDQRVLAGVGNIYADEACFAARLHPRRRACSLKRSEAERLRNALQTVLEHAISRRGATIRNYIGGSGLRGRFQDEFQAYGRRGQPCPRCAASIHVERVAGRASHFCPKCQKL